MTQRARMSFAQWQSFCGELLLECLVGHTFFVNIDLVI